VNAQHLHLRALAAPDAPQYRALMLHAYAVEPDAFTATPEEREGYPLSWWEARIAAADGMSLALGAFMGDTLAGTVALEFSARPKTRHKAHLIGMFVSETARGLGAGRALVRAALAAASKKAGVRTVTLTVTEGNAPAVALYETCGFRAFGTEPLAIATPEGFKAKVHMWLELP
jgi:ribosomal protein S18 acetylase RimI-like enzyme